MTRAWLVFCCACLPLSGALAQDAPYRPQLSVEQVTAELGEDFYGVYIQGTKCGWGRMALARREKPTPHFVATFEMDFRLTSMGEQVELESRSVNEFEVTPPFRWRGGTSIERQGDQVVGRSLQQAEGKLTITTFTGKERRQLEVAPVDYALGDELASICWARAQPRQVGESVVTRSLDEDEGRLKLDTLTVREVRQSLVDGVKARLLQVSIHNDEEGEVVTGIIGPRGEMLSGTFYDSVEIRMEPEELAKQVQYSADLFVSGMVRVDKPLGDVASLTRLQLRLEGPAADKVSAASLQTVSGEEGERVLTVDVLHGELLPAAEGDAERYTRETPDMPWRHPKLMALARQAVGDAQTPQEKIARLVHFVSDYVEDAYGQDRLDVLDVVEAKVGDCTEHAELFTALARAAGFPARQVSGLIYMGDDVQAFGGHAWNEVLLDGHWLPVDPTWDEPRINAGHVNLGHEGGAGFMSSGKLRFELIDLSRGE